MPARYPIFQIRNFRLLVFTRFVLTCAQQVQGLAVGWQVYAITRDPLYLGLIGLAEALPAIGIALYAGHLVDQARPQRVYWSASLVLFAGALLLTVGTSGRVGLTDKNLVALIFLVIFLTGLCRGFLSPAHFTMTAESLTPDQLKISAPWMSGAWQTATIVGPALGGVLYVAVGALSTYAFVSLLMAIACVLCARIELPERLRAAAQIKEPALRSIAAGLRFVFRDEVILAALSLDMFGVFFGGATSVLPMFVDQVLRAGPVALGWLRAAPSMGSILMALYLVHRPILRHAGRYLLVAVAGFGLCMIGFGLSRSLLLSVALLMLSGALDNISVNVRFTLLQLLAPPAMRGRIAAVNSIFIGSSNELGEFESGLTAKWMGLVPSIVFGGAATLVVVAGVGWLAPKLRALDLERV